MRVHIFSTFLSPLGALRTALLSLMISLSVPNRLPAQGFLWAQGAGGSGEDVGNQCAISAGGEIYVVGQFSSTARFGDTNLVSAGDTDLFLAKYSAAGQCLWVKQAGGVQADKGNAICISKTGEIYITGSFEGAALFDGVAVSGAGLQLFVAKYDPAGAIIWVKNSVGGVGQSIAADHQGDIVVSGFQGAWFAERRIYTAKYNSAGSILWESSYNKIFSSLEESEGARVAVAPNGDVFVAGTFSEGMTTNGVSVPSYGMNDMFLMKYNSAGVFRWIRTGGSYMPDAGHGLAVDDSGNAYVTGKFYRVASFGSTNISTELQSNSNSDAFVAKYDSDGKLIWVSRPLSENYEECGYAICVDRQRNIYVTGLRGGSAMYFFKLDAEGNFVWDLTVSQGRGRGIVLNPLGEAIITGNITAGAWFDNVLLTNKGSSDMYLTKLSDQIPPVLLTQPISQSLRTGTSPKLSVIARSYVPATYQWLFEGEPIVGATNKTLSVNNATAEQSGTYTMLASNLFGVSTSESARLVFQPRYITGQWDFDQGDLSATIGTPLEYMQNTANATVFTNSVINGSLAKVMLFPACTTTQGYVMHHGAAPNKGGPKVNQWTMIMDVYLWNTNPIGRSTFLQPDPGNLSPNVLCADWSNGSAGIGVNVFYRYPPLKTNNWNRIAFAVDAGTTLVITKYLNGKRVGEEQLNGAITNDISLYPTALLFADRFYRTLVGMVNSIQFRDYKMTDSEIALLGGPSANGIPVFQLKPMMAGSTASPSFGIGRLDETMMTSLPSNFHVYVTTNLDLPFSNWTRCEETFFYSNKTLMYVEPPANAFPQRFYSILQP